jgi:hypothetical protein
MNTKNFEIVVDGVPHKIKATAFSFNDETRFNVEYNGSEELIFVWDSSLKRLSAIGDESINLPDTVEVEIAAKLQSWVQ